MTRSTRCFSGTANSWKRRWALISLCTANRAVTMQLEQSRPRTSHRGLWWPATRETSPQVPSSTSQCLWVSLYSVCLRFSVPLSILLYLRVELIHLCSPSSFPLSVTSSFLRIVSHLRTIDQSGCSTPFVLQIRGAICGADTGRVVYQSIGVSEQHAAPIRSISRIRSVCEQQYLDCG